MVNLYYVISVTSQMVQAFRAFILPLLLCIIAIASQPWKTFLYVWETNLVADLASQGRWRLALARPCAERGCLMHLQWSLTANVQKDPSAQEHSRRERAVKRRLPLQHYFLFSVCHHPAIPEVPPGGWKQPYDEQPRRLLLRPLVPQQQEELQQILVIL